MDRDPVGSCDGPGSEDPAPASDDVPVVAGVAAFGCELSPVGRLDPLASPDGKHDTVRTRLSRVRASTCLVLPAYQALQPHTIVLGCGLSGPRSHS